MITIEQPRPYLVTIRFSGRSADEDFVGYFQQMNSIHRERRRFGLLIDATSALLPTGAQLRMQSAWLRERDADIKRNVTAMAFAISSPAIRGALKAVWWFDRANTLKHRAFADPKTAQEWVGSETLLRLDALGSMAT